MEAPLENIINNQKKRSTFLHVLTILTFIGSAYGAYQLINAYFNSDDMRMQLEKSIIQMEDSNMSETWIGFAKYGLRMTDLMEQNKMLVLLTGALCIGLCVFGAIQMRKLLRMGFYIWLLGEFLPFVVWVIIAGSEFFHPAIAFQFIVPVAFTIMYASQLKSMK